MEDSRPDVYLIREAIRSASVDAHLEILADGEQAMRYFEALERDEAAACPDLIILDINLPKRSGGEVLQRIRKSARCAEAAVLVVTSSDSTSDRQAMAALGVSGYFRKPSEFEDFMKLGPLVKRLLDGAA